MMKKLLVVLLAVVAMTSTYAEEKNSQFPMFKKMAGKYVVRGASYALTRHTLSWQEDTVELYLGDGLWSRTYYMRTYRDTYEADEQPTWDYEAWSVQIPFNWHIESVGQSSTIVVSHLYPIVGAQIMQQRYVSEKDTFTITTPGDVNMTMLEQEFKNLRLSISSPNTLQADLVGYRDRCSIVRLPKK